MYEKAPEEKDEPTEVFPDDMKASEKPLRKKPIQGAGGFVAATLAAAAAAMAGGRIEGTKIEKPDGKEKAAASAKAENPKTTRPEVHTQFPPRLTTQEIATSKPVPLGFENIVQETIEKMNKNIEEMQKLQSEHGDRQEIEKRRKENADLAGFLEKLGGSAAPKEKVRGLVNPENGQIPRDIDF